MSNNFTRATVNVIVPNIPDGDYLDTKDVAKVARKILATTFPGVKFSVTIDRFSGGSSVHIRWTDGPTDRQVNDAIGFLAGVEPDYEAGEGQRYKKGHILVNGKPRQSYCWVSTSRDYSDTFTARIEQRLARKRGAGEGDRFDRENELYRERHRATLSPEGHLVVFSPYGYR